MGFGSSVATNEGNLSLQVFSVFMKSVQLILLPDIFMLLEFRLMFLDIDEHLPEE